MRQINEAYGERSDQSATHAEIKSCQDDGQIVEQPVELVHIAHRDGRAVVQDTDHHHHQHDEPEPYVFEKFVHNFCSALI